MTASADCFWSTFVCSICSSRTCASECAWLISVTWVATIFADFASCHFNKDEFGGLHRILLLNPSTIFTDVASYPLNSKSQTLHRRCLQSFHMLPSSRCAPPHRQISKDTYCKNAPSNLTSKLTPIAMMLLPQPVGLQPKC